MGNGILASAVALAAVVPLLAVVSVDDIEPVIGVRPDGKIAAGHCNGGCGNVVSGSFVPFGMVQSTHDAKVRDCASEEARNPLVKFYVAPNGKDGASGSAEDPFANLEDAQRAIRRLNLAATGGVCVNVRGGTYPIKSTLTLTAEDSGSVSAPIVYRAYGNEKPVLDGDSVWRRFDRMDRAGFPKMSDRRDSPTLNRYLISVGMPRNRAPSLIFMPMGSGSY